MIKFVYGICPVFIEYTDKELPNRFIGTSRAFFIKIKKGCEEDKGLLAHEIEHCKQFYRTFGIGDLLYTYSKKWKLKYELDAYKVQLRYAPENKRDNKAWLYAGFVDTRYGLDVNRYEIKAELLKEFQPKPDQSDTQS